MDKKQADRFKNWHDFIRDNVKDEEFDMGSFCTGGGSYDEDGKFIVVNPENLFKKNKCGTTGCLAGYLPVIFNEFCYPNKTSDKPCLIKNIKLDKEKLKPIGKNTKVIESISINPKVSNRRITLDVSEFFGLEIKDVQELIYADKTTRKGMLYSMIEMADKYGWIIL